jgi:hypothetical protein
MKFILDDFIVCNDVGTNMSKLISGFLKCKEYGINFNLEKCVFMVFLGIILGFNVSREGKLLDPNKA